MNAGELAFQEAETALFALCGILSVAESRKTVAK